MKMFTKISAAVASLALGTTLLVGCTNVHDDLEVAMVPGYILGGATATASGTGVVDMWSTKAVPLSFTDGTATYEFEYTSACATTWGDGDGKTSFKLTLDTAPSVEWGTSEASFALGTEYTLEASGGNCVLKGLTEGNTYKVTIKASGATITAKVEQTSGSSTTTDIDDADVSVLNSTTATQAGAYLKLEGTSAGDTTGSVYAYFYGGTTATAYFETGDEFANWGNGNHFAAWFKFYAGDGTTLGIDSKQFGAGSTTLGTAISITNENTNNLEVTDLTAAGTYKMVVNTTADGATITITKVE